MFMLRLLLLLLTALLLTALPLAAQTAEQLFADRKYPAARAAFETRLAANRDDDGAMYHLGRIAAIEGKAGDAASWFERAIKRDPGNATYHFWLGSALGDEAQNASKIRQPFLARRVRVQFEKAVALDPRMIEPRMGLVDFYSIAPGVMGGSMAKAREQAAALVPLNPMRGHLAFARIALREKNDSAAIAAFEASIAAAPDSAPAYHGLSNLYGGRQRYTEALAVLDQLLLRRNDQLVAHARYGIIAAAGGIDMERGERELRYFLANAPRDNTSPQSYSNVHFWLGRILDQTGRTDEAQREYAEALKWNPKNEDARKAVKR